MEVTGKPIAANVVALGAISVLGRCAGSDAVLQAILNQFAPKLHDMNRKAFQAGIVSAQSLLA